jgi:hypothetical protein
MNNEQYNIQAKLEKWAKETVEVYKKQSTEIGFYTQTPLSIFLKDNIQKPDLLILGINPGSGGGIRRNTGTELLKGNPCFEGMDSERIIKNMSEEKDNNKNRKGWALWHRVNNMLKFSNNEDHKKILRNLDRFVLSNMIFFGTEKENQIPNIKREECAKQTIELISILQPKVVLLLGSQSRKLFDRVSENKLEVLVPNSMYHCMSGKSHVLAIKHTAYYYSSIEMELIGKTIGYILDHSEEIINKECIYASYIKEDIICFEESQMANQPKRKAKMDSTRIIELIITSPYFQLTQIEKENYSLSKNLMIRITKTGKGYLAIRHKTFNGKIQYPNSKYDFTERYRNILMEKGWNCDTPVWLGTKLIKDYGHKDDEIVTKIVSEINDIVELVNKDY